MTHTLGSETGSAKRKRPAVASNGTVCEAFMKATRHPFIAVARNANQTFSRIKAGVVVLLTCIQRSTKE